MKVSTVRATTIVFGPENHVADPISANEGRTWTHEGNMFRTHNVVIEDDASLGIPRRLMPIECERLQGWRDGWTNVPKTTILQPDDAGLFGQAMTEIEYEYPSDAKRYRAIGNGVAEPVAAWIAWRIRLAAAEAYVKLQSSIHQ